MSMLNIKDLTIRYDHKIVLKNLNARVEKGEIISLIGLNGSGKTTLLRAILGLIKPDSGEIKLNTKRIGYVPQKLESIAVLPITLIEFLKLYMPQKANTKTLAAVISQVGLTGKENLVLGSLSGGELKRALIANALLQKPDLLLLDEPLAGVDLVGEEDIYELIKTVNREQNLTIIMVSHDLHTVFAHANRIFCLDGCLCCQGTPVEVSNHASFQKIFGKNLVPFKHKHGHHSHS